MASQVSPDSPSLISNLTRAIESGSTMEILIASVYFVPFVVALILIFEFTFRRSSFSRFFYISEFEKPEIRDIAKRLAVINHRVASLEKRQQSVSSGDTRETARLIAEEYLKENIHSMTRDRLNASELIEGEIKSRFDEYLLNALNEFLARLNAEDVLKAHSQYILAKKSEAATAQLSEMMERERASSSMMKGIMINLFIIVNFSLLLTYFFYSGSINQYTALATTGLYVSLACFIIYVFRSSNARTSALLAIREDIKNQLLVVDYVNTKITSEGLNEHDIDFVKLILTNHAEREKQTKHPYEVILKGVSGSNIQLGNGKFSAAKASPEKDKS